MVGMEIYAKENIYREGMSIFLTALIGLEENLFKMTTSKNI